jgi:4-hydroxy-tetrahydrodipicolinate synthase
MISQSADKKIYSASMTPLSESGEIDHQSTERLLGKNLQEGISGFFFFGTMGEGALLTRSMRDELLKTATSVIGNDADILTGTLATGTNGIIENIECYSQFGCTGYVVQFPFGFAAPTDPVQELHFIADRADKPIFLYYLPQVNGVTLSKEQFRDVFSHPNIRGIKNSSDSLKTRKELLMIRESVDFELFEGQEWVVDDSLAAGYDGALVGMASLGAKLFVSIARAVDRGDTNEARRLQSVMIDIFDGVYGKDVSRVWIGQKYALTHLGILGSAKCLVPSQQHLSDEQKQRIEQCIDTYRDYLV